MQNSKFHPAAAFRLLQHLCSNDSPFQFGEIHLKVIVLLCLYCIRQVHAEVDQNDQAFPVRHHLMAELVRELQQQSLDLRRF